jgi:hypothetical protein
MTGWSPDWDGLRRAASGDVVPGVVGYDVGFGRVGLNITDRNHEDWAEAYYDTNYDRLTSVKQSYAPDSWFRFPELPKALVQGRPGAHSPTCRSEGRTDV